LAHPEVESLIRCGTMASFGCQPRLLWELALRWRAVREVSSPRGSATSVSQGALSWDMADTHRLQQLIDKLPDLVAYDPQKQMQAELEVLEVTLAAHPFALFDKLLAWVRSRRCIIASRDLRHFVGKDIYLLGWKVTSKQTRTVHDETMCFVTFSDTQGRFEVSFFPEVYERYARELYRGYGPYLIKGRVESSFGVAEVVAQHLKLLSVKDAPG